MSMLTQFFPEQGFIRNPKYLSRAFCSNINLKNGTTAKSVSDTTFFTTDINNFGNYVALSADNVYQTVCDINNSGFMSNIVSTAGTSGTVYLRITVDGIEYIIEKAVSVGNRILVGYYISSTISTSNTQTYTGHIDLNGYNDTGFYKVGTGKDVSTPYQNVTLLNPDTLRGYGLPLLRFDKSLKVEAKVTVRDTNNARHYAGVIYILD